MNKYKIGNYDCPRPRMSTDCVYVGNRRKKIRPPNSKNDNGFDLKRDMKLPFDGVTSMNAGHYHRYRVHKNRKVTIYDATHPDISEIKHKHRYIGKWPDGYVQRNQSDCYPCNYKNPRTGIKEDGAYEHPHALELETRIINNINPNKSYKS